MTDLYPKHGATNTSSKGFYLAKISFAFRLTPESPEGSEAPEIWLEVCGAIGWGKEAKANQNEFSLGRANFVGGSISIGSGVDTTYYLREIVDMVRGQ